MADNPPAETFHPMEYVLEELEARNISPDMAGRMLKRMVDLSLTDWFDFIAGGPVTPKLAKGLSTLFGTGEEVWHKLQRAYDAAAVRTQSETLRLIEKADRGGRGD